MQESVNMNNRIRELGKQSGLEIFGLGARKEIWEAAVQKFARLIVEESVHFLKENNCDFEAEQLEEYWEQI